MHGGGGGGALSLLTNNSFFLNESVRGLEGEKATGGTKGTGYGNGGNGNTFQTLLYEAIMKPTVQ